MEQQSVRIDLGPWQVRSFSLADVPALAKHADNPNVAATLRDRFPQPYTQAHAVEWIEHATSQRPQRNFAITSELELIGGIGLEFQHDVHARSAEVGFWLAEPYWGRGIATRALVALTEHAFANFELLRIYAMVFSSNEASARVLEKAGYEFEGRLRMSVVKRGRILDQLVYSRINRFQGTERG